MRVRLLTVLLLAGALVAPASAAAAAAPAPCADADLAPAAAAMPRVRVAIVCLLNRERAARGRPALRTEPTLRGVAGDYARLMVELGFFDHVSPHGSTMLSRVRATSYLQRTVAWSLGENLAWGSGDLSTPAATVAAWMRSSGHRANILDARFREVGVGVALGAPADLDSGDSAATYVTEFGRRLRR
jgi:uncharacterized protein YkwD